MDSLVKTPEDQFNIFFFFDGDMAADETVESFDVYSGNNDDGTTSTSSIIAATSQTDQQIEVVLLAGQVDGEQHKITALVYTSLGNTFEKDIFLDVIELTVGDLRKQPSEQFVIGFDFNPHMESDETLDNATIVVTATDTNTGEDVASSVIGEYGVDTDDTNQVIRVGVFGGSPEDFINITVKVNCTNQVLSQDKTFKRTVSMAIYDDGYYGTFSADGDNSDETILRNGCATLAVTGGGGPFTWTVSGTGFSFANPVTAGLTNELCADGTACGSATATVTNTYGQTVEIGVREPNNGQWVEVATNADVPAVVTGAWDSIENANKRFYKVSGKYKLREEILIEAGGLGGDLPYYLAPNSCSGMTDLGHLTPGCSGAWPTCGTAFQCSGSATFSVYARVLYEWQC